MREICCTTVDQLTSSLNTLTNENPIEQNHPRGNGVMRLRHFALEVTMQYLFPPEDVLLDSVCIPHVPICYGCLSTPGGIPTSSRRCLSTRQHKADMAITVQQRFRSPTTTLANAVAIKSWRLP